jgi:hypothetical protein
MPDDQEPQKSEQNGSGNVGLYRALKYMHLAFVLPFSVVAGMILGSFANRWIGLTWLDKAGALLGLVAGIVEMYRMLKQLQRESQ